MGWLSRDLTVEEKKQSLEKIRNHLKEIKDYVEAKCEMVEGRGRDAFNEVRMLRWLKSSAPLLENSNYEHLKILSEAALKEFFFLHKNIPKSDEISKSILYTLITKANEYFKKKEFTSFLNNIIAAIEESDRLLTKVSPA